jgi:hypothetical protein
MSTEKNFEEIAEYLRSRGVSETWIYALEKSMAREKYYSQLPNTEEAQRGKELIQRGNEEKPELHIAARIPQGSGISDLIIYQEDLDMIKKSRELAKSMKKAKPDIDIKKVVNDAINNLPTGPDTTENIQEINNAPEINVIPGKQDSNEYHSFNEILHTMADLHQKKNSNYGDAAYKGYREFGLIYYIIQLHNKLNRLKSLSRGEDDKVGESIDDTLMDMACYAVMALEARHRDNG